MALSREVVMALFASAAGAGAFVCAARWARQLERQAAAAGDALQAAQAALQHEKDNRAMERKGRTNAEKQLRHTRMQLAAAQAAASAAGHPAAAPGDGGGGGGGAADEAGDGDEQVLSAAASSVAGVRGTAPPISMFPFRPIGYLHTCFSTRNGTPRQPLLVPSARSVLRLAPSFPADCLEGLTQYSHCWVLYIFHANTDMPKVIANAMSALGVDTPAPTSFKAKIRVPRLDGGKMGVLATRTPHRPAPIGLSVAKILGVEGNRLILGGADIVDGSPVLDIKPYVPFCDSVPGATAPAWVQAEASDEPLKLSEVVFPPEVEAQVYKVWKSQRAASVYGSAAEVVTLIKEVLARDIRSLNQRLHIHPVGDKAAAAGAGAGPGPGAERQRRAAAAKAGEGEGEGPPPARGQYIVVLDQMDVTYDLTVDGAVVLRGVYPLGGGVGGGEALAAEAAAAAERVRARQRQAAPAAV